MTTAQIAKASATPAMMVLAQNSPGGTPETLARATGALFELIDSSVQSLDISRMIFLPLIWLVDELLELGLDPGELCGDALELHPEIRDGLVRLDIAVRAPRCTEERKPDHQRASN
jgi:hypothetical protein